MNLLLLPLFFLPFDDDDPLEVKHLKMVHMSRKLKSFLSIPLPYLPSDVLMTKFSLDIDWLILRRRKV